jgi:heme-degrading monooxygenase HmoA
VSTVIVQTVRFNSELPDEEVRATFAARAPRYQEVSGLLQKLYLQFGPGEFGAVYLWDSTQSLKEFRESELARTIPHVYRVSGPPRVEIAELAMVLYPALTHTAP